MATVIESGIEWGGRARALGPDRYERVLAIGSLVLPGCVAVALAKGHDAWDRVPMLIWLHLATVIVALALTPVMLLRRRGDAPHRALGTIWAVAMIATAALSLGIRTINPGGFSIIHLLSLFTLVQVPVLWWSARTHRVARHRRAVRGLVTGALLVAGAFTFPFHRLPGGWLFG